MPSSLAHGDARSETAPAHPQQPGPPAHRQHRCQAKVPHGGHGLPLYHVLRGGKSGTLSQRRRRGAVYPPPSLLVSKKSDLEVKGRAWRPKERVRGTPPPLWTSVSPSGPGSHSRIGVHKTRPTMGWRQSVQDKPFKASGVPLLLPLADHPRGPPPHPGPLPLSQLHRAAEQGGRG